MMHSKNIALVLFAFFTIVCKSQSYKLEDFDTPDRQRQIAVLTQKARDGQMNPRMKPVYAEFAVDTFKIGYFRRQFPTTKVNGGISLDVIKSACIMYDSLNNKYFAKLKWQLKGQDNADIIASQENWEKYRQSELSFFQRKIDEQLDFEINFYLTYIQILK